MILRFFLSVSDDNQLLNETCNMKGNHFTEYFKQLTNDDWLKRSTMENRHHKNHYKANASIGFARAI